MIEEKVAFTRRSGTWEKKIKREKSGRFFEEINEMEDTTKLIQSMIKDLKDLVKKMRNDYRDIIDDQKKEINLLVAENDLLGEQVKERSE